MRVYELSQLSMKFERHFDAEVVDFQVLSEDYSKCAFLCADRSVQLHARYGAHHRVRVPRAGRDLAFSPRTADLVVAASAPELYRLNLSEGRFLAPLATASPAVNAAALCPGHGLLACAGEGGGLELFDLRARRSAGWLPDAAALAGKGNSGNVGWRGGMGSGGDADLTAVRSDERGLTLAVGTSKGHVALFDLRSPLPLLTKDLMYGSPVVDLKFHGDAVSVRGGGGGGGAEAAFVSDFDEDGERGRGGRNGDDDGDDDDDENDGDDVPFSASPAAASSAYSSRVISADRHAVKIWSASDGRAHTSLQLPADSSSTAGGGGGGRDAAGGGVAAAGAINDVLVWPGRGLLMVAGETPVVHSFFVPSLGPAPRWCSFLEALTEELEEATTATGSGAAAGAGGNGPPAATVYDDFRFVTSADLDSHGLRHLLGTPALRPYMHGFFVHNRLWQRAAAAAGSVGALGGSGGEDYEASRRRRVEEKLEAARASRIAKVAKLPKVNAALAARALAGGEEGDGGGGAGESGGSEDEGAGKSGGGGGARAKAAASAAAAARRLLADDRFSAMFRDPAFAVDEASEEYKLLHPNASEASARAKRLLREHFDAVDGGEKEEESEESGSEEESGSGSDDDDESGSGSDASTSSDDDDEPRPPPAQRQRRMFAAKDAAAAAAFGAGVSLAADRKVPLAARAAAAEAKGLGGARAWASGSREATFIPRSGGGRGRGGGGGGGGGRGRGGGRGGGGRGRGARR